MFFEGETTVAVQGLSILRMGVKIEGNINQKLAPEARLDGEKNNKCSTCVSLIHGHDEIQFNMHGVYGGNSKGHGRETIRIMSYHRPPKELSTSSC